MQTTLFSLILLTSPLQNPGFEETDNASSFNWSTGERSHESLDVKIRSFAHQISERALNYGAGIVLGSASLIARMGWGLSQITPFASTISNECLLVSHVCGTFAYHLFTQSFAPYASVIPVSHLSWHANRKDLSQIPASSAEDKELLNFLEKRWLAKSTGFYSILVNRICPCFEISFQVHPETTNSYARDPWNKFSQTYTSRIEHWKNSLPQPPHFPLILTRPHSLNAYLPSLIEVSSQEKIESCFEHALQENESNVVVDVTSLFSEESTEWLKTWDGYQTQLLQACTKFHLNPAHVLCVQSVSQQQVGGIRLLPFSQLSQEEIEEQHQFLLHWISKFGLSANRVELDRCGLSRIRQGDQDSIVSLPLVSKDALLSSLNSFEKTWDSIHPEKALMVSGTVRVLKGLLTHLSDATWNTCIQNPTRSGIVQLSFLKIEALFEQLNQTTDDVSFYDVAAQLEQIHAHLTALLEVFSPFTFEDFPLIYQNALKSIPKDLYRLTSYGIHSSGMTSLAGIFKAVENSIGKPPRILYGDNTYFENILTAEKISQASPVDSATAEDFENVDLILAQYNPILRRIDFEVTAYKVEEIEETLHQIFRIRSNKPLTLAVDCTLDYLDSARVGDLLAEFQDEIEQGKLNVIAYRSGLKFDLFGMDNYCGAPLYMIHNSDSHWKAFDALITDPLLQTDRLSLNWFCLAYQNAAQELDLYRKQVFDNTRALLDQVPKRLFTMTQNINYRIVPIDEQADAAFIDIKIFGPLHEIKGSLIGGFLTLKCMEKSHPLFYRPSLGFYHPNLSILFSEKCTTIRLTLGLDPTQVDVLVDSFKTIDSLNGEPLKLPFLPHLLMHK